MINKPVVGENLIIDAVKGIITIIHADGSETTKELPVKEVVVNKPLCNVGVSAQFTKNMGNYQSARVSVSLNIPSEYGEINEIYAFAKEWVDQKMQESIDGLG
jgi:hypothetical protein